MTPEEIRCELKELVTLIKDNHRLFDQETHDLIARDRVNYSAMQRARKLSIELAKQHKKYREMSVKFKKAQKENKSTVQPKSA